MSFLIVPPPRVVGVDNKRVPFCTVLGLRDFSVIPDAISTWKSVRGPVCYLFISLMWLVEDFPDIGHCPRILSLDGGGVRGLSSLLILRNIMEEITRRSNIAEARPCEYFDLIGGTGTGGLIAIMLGRLRMVRTLDSSR